MVSPDPLCSWFLLRLNGDGQGGSYLLSMDRYNLRKSLVLRISSFVLLVVFYPGTASLTVTSIPVPTNPAPTQQPALPLKNKWITSSLVIKLV